MCVCVNGSGITQEELVKKNLSCCLNFAGESESFVCLVTLTSPHGGKMEEEEGKEGIRGTKSQEECKTIQRTSKEEEGKGEQDEE